MSTDREREALAALISKAAQPSYVWGTDVLSDMTARRAAAALLAAGWMPRPEPGSADEDAMVERAMAALTAQPIWPCHHSVRAALRAALGTGGSHDR